MVLLFSQKNKNLIKAYPCTYMDMYKQNNPEQYTYILNTVVSGWKDKTIFLFFPPLFSPKEMYFIHC